MGRLWIDGGARGRPPRTQPEQLGRSGRALGARWVISDLQSAEPRVFALLGARAARGADVSTLWKGHSPIQTQHRRSILDLSKRLVKRFTPNGIKWVKYLAVRQT